MDRNRGWKEEDRGRRGGTEGGEGVMHPQDGAAARPEDTGAKAADLGPGLSLLQQVGCWHLSLGSWVSNAAPPPSPFYLVIYILYH